MTIVHVNPFNAGTDFRRQNMTAIDDPRTERVNIYNAVDPWNRYSNKAAKITKTIIYDDFKFKKTFGLLVYKQIFHGRKK